MKVNLSNKKHYTLGCGIVKLIKRNALILQTGSLHSLEGLRFDLSQSLPDLVNIRGLALHRGPGWLEHGRVVLVLLLHKQLKSQTRISYYVLTSTRIRVKTEQKYDYASNTVNDNRFPL